MSRRTKLTLTLLASTVAIATPAFAQTAAHVEDGLHDENSAEIVVTGRRVENLDILAGTSVLSDSELAQHIRPQLGDTLTELPGVSATSFTPGASRPVLRGFQGERISVLTDGIGSIDASNTSADHAVTLDPLTAYRIEVLRGPASLLYGSQAIGGAVNVLDRRIPREMPDEPIHIDALANYASAANERSLGLGLDLPLASRFVAHADGSYRNTDDLEVPGDVLTPALRAETLGLAAEQATAGNRAVAASLRDYAGLSGVVPNTATETYSLGGGLAFIDDRGNLGASVSYYNSNYGIPDRPGAGIPIAGSPDAPGPDIVPDPVTIGLHQYRADLRGQVKIAEGFFESVDLRLGSSDYRHTEFEGDEVGTIFLVSGLEARAEAHQRFANGWSGTFGAQVFARDFNAIGDEAFVPKNSVEQAGLFALEDYEAGPFGLNFAGRFEHTDVDAGTIGISRAFDAVSGAIGAHYDIVDAITIGTNLSRTERAPSAEELFSNGPHVATQSFELGDPTFGTERSIGLEAYVRGTVSGATFSLTGFSSWFDNFIYETDTGDELDGLPVFQYGQRAATYWGFEGEASAPLTDIGKFHIVADLVTDYVHATIDGLGPAPRIPPLRVLAGLEAQSDRIDGRVESEFVTAQNRTAAFETPTDGFTLINASISWRPFGRDNATAVFSSVNNIFDVNARRAASFTKDFVPLPGRDFRLGVRASF